MGRDRLFLAVFEVSTEETTILVPRLIRAVSVEEARLLAERLARVRTEMYSSHGEAWSFKGFDEFIPSWMIVDEEDVRLEEEAL